MEAELKESILGNLSAQEGHVGFYFKDLIRGEILSYKADDQYNAASVIKLPIFMVLSKLDAEKKISMEDKIKIRQEDKVPICGALTLFTDEPECDIRTLCNLMISLSDNTATCVLIDYLGIPVYQEEFSKMGLEGTELNRKIYEDDPARKPLFNYIVPREMSMLLEQIYRGEFVSPEVSGEIKDTLLKQQINHKICGIIGDKYEVAHKTGEEDHTSNDVGIVYTERPFTICFAGYDTNLADWEDFMRKSTAALAEYCDAVPLSTDFDL